MRAARLLAAGAVLGASMTLTACAGANHSDGTTPTAPAGAIPPVSARASTRGAELLDWSEFGLDPQRSDASELATGITAANVAHLRRRTLTLPGTVDSSPIFLHAVKVDGATHDVVIVTTTYGRTLAIDADGGSTLWSFIPAGYDSWAGSAQITVTSPLADPDREYVYSASPDGLVHKLSLANGSEVRSGDWPARVTLEPHHEKMDSALNIDGPDLVVVTGGYLGDIPPYQGHVALVNRASGSVTAIFNTLCANRRRLQVPSSCPASDSGIISRGGAVVEPGSGRILIDTGNGPWNGSTNFGDSVVELTFPALQARQFFTPSDQEYLNDNDLDLGSSAPALLGHNRVILAGKDGIIRVLALSRLDGHGPGSRALGGEVQQLPLPGGGELWTVPAVWQRGGRTTVFIADENATAAYVLRSGRLYRVWQNSNPGTSPLLVGGLLYAYDPASGGINVYHPGSATPIATLPGSAGHWNSPIVVDGHVIEPEGDANAHLLTGTLDIFSAS